MATFNFAIAAGALVGGPAVDGISAPAAPLTGAVLMAAAAGTAWAASNRRSPRAGDAVPDHGAGDTGRLARERSRRSASAARRPSERERSAGGPPA
ncbi:hypothetical protein [Streptomyces sp. LN699]|uniref:hypothetical protein n=1 Tax=Streptomyces sp. LN699 TaxID=3112981 RepID=UPI00371C4095